MRILLIGLLFLSLGATTTKSVIRDRSGRPVLQISEQKGRQVFRSASGQILGTSSRTGSRTLYRDASGRPIASKTDRKK
jgi:YD repeat-containing protein